MIEKKVSSGCIKPVFKIDISLEEKMMTAKVFKKHKKVVDNAVQDNTYSLRDFCTMESNLLESSQFYIDKDISAFELNEAFFYEIKMQILVKGEKQETILQFTDVSARIKYDVLTGNQQMLQTINATVSHEMRNPLNSIMSQNLKQEELANRLDRIV